MSSTNKISLSDMVIIIVPTLVAIIHSYFYFFSKAIPMQFSKNIFIENVQDALVFIIFTLGMYNLFQKEWEKYKGFLLTICFLMIFVILNETKYLHTILGIDASDIFQAAYIRKVFSPLRLFITGIHFFVAAASLIIILVSMIFYKNYQKIPILSDIPKLSRNKYIFITVFLIWMFVFATKEIFIPLLHPGITLNDIREYKYLFENIGYLEVIFTAGYLLGAVLLIFKPRQLE